VGGDRAALAFLTRSVGENLLAASWAHFRRGPLLDLARAYASAAAVAKGLDLVYAGLEAPMASLSGGNQQKVLLGRALLAGPRLLLLDDPAVGVDPPTRTAFYRRVRALAREGLGVLLYASDEEELLQNAHRVLVLAGGRLVAELRGPELTREGLIAAGLRAGGGHG
jgi:ribose transport system ATP-binding protein